MRRAERKRALILAGAAAAAGFAAAWLLARRAPARPLPPDKVGNFRLLDQNGLSRELYALSGKRLVVVVMHGVGCPVVRQHAPSLRELEREFAPRGAAFLLLNANPQDDRAAIAAEAREFGFTAPILKDDSQAVARALKAARTGEAIVLDPARWTVVWRGAVDDRAGYGWQREAPSRRHLAEALERLLAGREPPPAAASAAGCLIDFAAREPADYAAAAAVLRKRCLECHGAGDAAPALTSHAAVRSWAPMIRETLLTGVMPPAPADAAGLPLMDDWTPTPAERRALLRWIDDGTPRGAGPDPLAAPAPKERTPPDALVFEAESPVGVPASGQERVELLPLAPRVERDLWIEGVEVSRVNKRVAHHVQLMRLPESLPDDPQERRRVLMNPANVLSAGPVGWRYRRAPAGTAIFIPKGTRLGLNAHYVPVGRAETDRPAVALHLAPPGAPPRELKRTVLQKFGFTVPAGDASFELAAESVLEEDAVVVGFWPHMHLRGSWMRLEATVPGGRPRLLVSVPRFSTRGQRLYALEKPLSLPRGTRLVARGAFDNSASNPRNPSPGQPARGGPKTTDEMFEGHVYWVRPESARAVLSADAVFERDILDTHRRGAGRFARALPPMDIQRRAWGYAFASDKGCDDPGDDKAFCAMARPKPWTEAEIDHMGRILESLSAPGKLKTFMERGRANGFDTMVRESVVTHSEPGKSWHPLYYPNSLHGMRQIVIGDSLFAPLGRPEKPMLHLMAHAFDFSGRRGDGFYPESSVSPDFLRLTGFKLMENGWGVEGMSRADRAEFYALFAWKNAEALKAWKLEGAARSQAWREINRRTDAYAARHKVPTFHALLNPYEAFAEWAAFVYFEQDKARALNPELTEWFLTRILR